MNCSLPRRAFLQHAAVLAAGAALERGRAWAVSGGEARGGGGTANAARLGWRLGVHAYSFRQFSLHEAIAKTAALGLRHLGAYPTQALGPGRPGVQVSAALSAADRRELRQRLADARIALVHYGVCGFDRGVEQFRAEYDFAAELGVEAILAEPPEDAFDALEALCEEYRIDLAIHNHPEKAKNSRFWHPRIVLQHCAGRSRRFGACADTGQWARSDLDPVACLRQLEGRLLALHIKDMNQPGMKGHCVPLGQGGSDVRGMLAEVRRQEARPVFMIEYEFNWNDNLGDIAECVRFFDATAAALAG